MCPSAHRVCSEPGGQKPVLSLSLDRIDFKKKVITKKATVSFLMPQGVLRLSDYTCLVFEKWIHNGENRCLPQLLPRDGVIKWEIKWRPIWIQMQVLSNLGSPHLAMIIKFDKIVKIGSWTQLWIPGKPQKKANRQRTHYKKRRKNNPLNPTFTDYFSQEPDCAVQAARNWRER